MKKETRQTIFMILFCILLMFADSIWEKVFGQVFAGPGITNKGAMVQMGVLANKTELCLSYVIPFTKNTNATIVGLQVGQKFNLTQWDSDNYSLMPYFGYGFLRWKDYTAYDCDLTGKTPIDNLSSFNPVFGLQVCKDSNAGQLFLSTQYCKVLYVGIGLKVFFSKL